MHDMTKCMGKRRDRSKRITRGEKRHGFVLQCNCTGYAKGHERKTELDQ